tara:strand:- start:12371 stop:12583 length:213 start_codon:yes stop_codon:yes gene_type:complete
MKKKINKKFAANIFNKIENTRKKNNKNWMDLLRLAYFAEPKKTYAILARILSKDSELVKLSKKLNPNNVK